MIDTLTKEVQLAKPDVLVLQEVPPTIFEVPGYTTIAWEGPGDTEMLGTMIKADSAWIAGEKDVVLFDTKTCPTERTVHMVSVSLKSNMDRKLNIANVHLCGGQHDESQFGGMAVKDLLSVKHESLEHVIKQGADIVLGDFNSDMEHFIKGSVSLAQQEYLVRMGWAKGDIVTWNNTPFQYLNGKGFKYVDIEGLTSFYKSKPDAIWYKNERLVVLKGGLLNMNAISDSVDPKGGASDHNGLFATFGMNIEQHPTAELSDITNIGQQNEIVTRMVDIIQLVGNGGIEVKSGDFAGVTGTEWSVGSPAYSKGDHFLLNPDGENSINSELVRIAAEILGAEMKTSSNSHPSYLFMGGGKDFARDPSAFDGFLWTEPHIKERARLYWPAYSALKTSAQTKIGRGFTRVVLEQAPPVLGYLTVFHVPESFYEKHGEVKIYKHSRSSSPPLCDSSEASLCGRVGYVKVSPKDSIDAILISRSAREAGVRPVLSITIGNSYYKTTAP